MKQFAVALAILAGLFYAVLHPQSADAATPRHDVVAVGDSITFGIGTSDPATRAYPAVAGVQGAAVPGSCVDRTDCWYQTIHSWFRTSIKSMRHKPTTVVAMIGINDMIQHHTYHEIIDGYHLLRHEARALNMRVVFGTITPVAAGSQFEFINPLRDRVNRWIRSQPEYVEYALPLETKKGSLDPAYDSGDTIHLNDRGERRMARTLENWCG